MKVIKGINKGEESEEEFYARVLKGTDKELDELVLGLLDNKANIGEWLVNHGIDKDRFAKVLNEAYEKLFAIDYFSWRIEELQGPNEPRPHQPQRDRVNNLIFWLNNIEPLVSKGEQLRKAAKPFIDGRKGPKSSGAKKEFNNWVKGKEDQIKKEALTGRGWKKHVFRWMQKDGVSVEKSAAYDYLDDFKK